MRLAEGSLRGLCWQVVLVQMIDLLNSADPDKMRRVMAAIMQMKKLDMKGLAADSGRLNRKTRVPACGCRVPVKPGRGRQ